MIEYIRRVAYHETDKMGITHHSNYIKWMEEARIHFLSEIGYGYAALERDGIVSPVVGVQCRYEHPTTFDDVVSIRVSVAEFRGVRLVIRYEMVNAADGRTVLHGTSEHCFLNENGRPILLKKQFPKFDAALRAQMEAEDAPREEPSCEC